MKIAILGAGPAALMAGYACERNDHEPTFFSRAEKSTVLGRMYLMRPLPGLTLLGDSISYRACGTAAGYATKVYGDPAAPVSWGDVEWGEHRPLWWLDSAYDILWARYQGNIVEYEVTALAAETIAQNYGLVISTLPANSLCKDGHHFGFHEYKLISHPSRTDLLEAENLMLYNGMPELEWFRFTRLAGQDTWEFPVGADYWKLFGDSQLIELSHGLKPVASDCNCHPKLHPVGRWACWRRGILNHHAFEQTQGLLASAGLGKEAA